MNNGNIIESIDEQELLKQNKQQIIDSGEYFRLEIIVGVNNEMPSVHAQLLNATPIEIAKCYVAYESAFETVFEKVPLAKELVKYYSCDNTHTILTEGGEDNEK